MVSAEITYEVWVRDYAYPEKSEEFDEIGGTRS